MNNRAENSHQPIRIRERQRKRFKSSEQAQRFLSVFESINAPFRLRRHLLSATRYRLLLNLSFGRWNKTALAGFVS
jgi:putative transposase